LPCVIDYRRSTTMITAYFKDEEGNTLVIDAQTFEEAYKQAIEQDFYVYDYDTEEWGQ